MQAYLYPIEQATLHFLIAAFLLTMPYTLVQYIRYGAVSKLRALILFSFFFYMLSAFYVVILPLPDPATMLSPHQEPFMQLIPFRFIYDFVTKTKLNIRAFSTYLPALKQNVVYEPAFNVLLTVPFGMYLAYYFKQNLKRTLIFTFALTLFFEVTQLTALYGFYPYPYRLFDVDDLMLNTLGGVIGFFLAKRLLVFLPTRDRIDQKNIQRSVRVGYLRRVFALGMDYIVFAMVRFVINAAGLQRLGTQALWDFLLMAALFIGFALVQWRFKQTLGKALVHIRLTQTRAGWPLPVALAVRYGILWLLVCFNLWRATLLPPVNGFEISELVPVGLLLLIGLDACIGFFTGKTLLYERISGMKNISTKRLPGADLV
ncbi:MAG: VanZ family protein [Oscillospiraceae bacterium]|jgi:glycopeptide antibiotics resistance protein|nr:VanZ family protein [Oscillospiraceae bacterium]